MDLNAAVNLKSTKGIINALVFMYSLLFLTNTIFLGKLFQSEIHWLEASFGLILGIFFILKLLSDSKKNKIKWIKENVFILIFFVSGLVTFYYNGFAYSVARTLFVEGIYLLILTNYLCESYFIKKYILKLLIYFNLLMNVLPYIMSLIIRLTDYNINFLNFLDKVSFITAAKTSAYSCFYANPNSMGIMTGLALLTAIALYDKKYKLYQKVLFGIYVAFSLFTMILSDCRSAMLSIIVAALGYIVIRISGNKYGKQLAAICFILIMLSSVVILKFINNYTFTGMENIKPIEKQMSKYSSDRYVIWKSTFMAQRDQLIWGRGSLKYVIENRDLFLQEKYPNYYTYKNIDLENPNYYEEQLDNIDLSKEDILTAVSTKLEELIRGRHSLFRVAVYDIEHVIRNKDTFFGNGGREAHADSNVHTEQMIQSPSQNIVHKNQIKNLDTHNGYLSIFFCTGIVGYAIFIILMVKKILHADILTTARWAGIVIYIFILNIFESALIVDRFFPCIFLFLILAMDDQRKKEANV